MRGRSNEYSFLEPLIIDILEKSEIPLQPLCISFKINEISGKIINFKVVKNRLDTLVEKRKVIKEIKEESILYSLRETKKKNS